MNKAFMAATVFVAVIGLSGMAAAQTGGSQGQSTEATFNNGGDGSVAGGNVSESDLQANRDVTDWAGFYGTLDQTVTLNDNGNTFYQWTASSVDGAAILAAEQGNAFSGDTSNLGTPNDVSGLTGVPTTGTERVSDTYNETDAKPADFQTTTADAPAATLDFGSASTNPFQNFLYNSTVSSATDVNQPVYVAEAQDGATAYNGDTGINYQLLVGTTDANDSTETFEFFAKIE